MLRPSSLVVVAALALTAQSPEVGQRKRLIYHDIRTDAHGHIVPWYADDPGAAYDHVLGLVWRYWKLMPNYWTNFPREYRQRWGKTAGVKKYMIQRTLDDIGIGGDQVAMVLDSWALYFAYTGDPEIVENMRYQADLLLAEGFSRASDAWPNLPYPCNTTNLPVYDGDLVAGKNFTQPDKAGSLGLQLTKLYKITGDARYFDAALAIAVTLAAKIEPGDAERSPLPYRVNAVTGEVRDPYTTNWTPTIELFETLIAMKQGDAEAFARARRLLLDWMKRYPLRTNRWGPFFEDIQEWSDTEINAGAMARYILLHPEEFPDWKRDVRGIQDWVLRTLAIDHWKHYGLQVIGEQTAYLMQGNSHTARHASIELLYAAKTGDLTRKAEAVRQLNWATYMVDVDGKNWYPNFEVYEIWWTDGYGDYVRHYIRSMAAFPELAPPRRNRLLDSTSVIRTIRYGDREIAYATFDPQGEETLRLTRRPRKVHGGEMRWQPLASGGAARIRRADSRDVRIVF
jgi:hypothetical protein